MGWRLANWARSTRGHKSGASKLCLITMATYADDDKGICWTSAATLAGDCECTTRQIYDHLRELQGRGFIEQVTRGNSHGSSSYRFLTATNLNRNNSSHTPASLNRNNDAAVQEENFTPKKEKEKERRDSSLRDSRASGSRTLTTEGAPASEIDRILTHPGFISYRDGGADVAAKDRILRLLGSGTGAAEVIAYLEQERARGRVVNEASLLHHFAGEVR